MSIKSEDLEKAEYQANEQQMASGITGSCKCKF